MCLQQCVSFSLRSQILRISKYNSVRFLAAWTHWEFQPALSLTCSMKLWTWWQIKFIFWYYWFNIRFCYFFHKISSPKHVFWVQPFYFLATCSLHANSLIKDEFLFEYDLLKNAVEQSWLNLPVKVFIITSKQQSHQSTFLSLLEFSKISIFSFEA